MNPSPVDLIDHSSTSSVESGDSAQSVNILPTKSTPTNPPDILETRCSDLAYHSPDKERTVANMSASDVGTSGQAATTETGLHLTTEIL